VREGHFRWCRRPLQGDSAGWGRNKLKNTKVLRRHPCPAIWGTRGQHAPALQGLDCAQDIIADVMDTLVRALRPPFRLAKLEGDAAFVYALADKLLQDSIEQAYFAFRKRLRSIKQANSCECQACSRMQSLDVKFVVHHGEFIRQKMAGCEETRGRDPGSSPA
jgi:hypothetical protein